MECAKLPISKHNKGQIPLQNYNSHCQFCGNQVRKFTSEFSQIDLVRNWGFSVWICERCVKCTGCMPQLITQDIVQRWDCGVLTFCMYENLLIDQTQRQYSGHNIPLSHCIDHSQWKYHFGNLKQIALKRGWPKTVHLAMEMCTPGAGCTLNFEHCIVMQCFLNQQLWLSINYKLSDWILLPCRHTTA